MAKRWISKAIKRPGRMKKRAAAAGRSVHAQMEHDKHSSDPSLRSAANLGLRLSAMSRSR
jgi:hypothetical protein